MKYRSDKSINRMCPAFSLMEVVASIAILGLVCSSVMVVFNRAMASVADSRLKMNAFEVARNNMEEMIAAQSLKEQTNYGTSEQYPDIEWQTKVETFYEPVSSQMWVRAISNATYEDSDGQDQEIELTHWITSLDKQELLDMLQTKSQVVTAEMDNVIADIDQAAQYAGVEPSTVEQWMDNGMPTVGEGYFTKGQLDLFAENDGKPTQQQIKQQKNRDLSMISTSTSGQQTAQSDQQPEQDQQQGDQQQNEQQQPQQQNNNPLGLPDGWQQWELSEILQWLRDHGKL